MRRQEEMIQNLFQQIGQLGAQNHKPDRAGPSGAAPGLGGIPQEHVDPTLGRIPTDTRPLRASRGTETQPEEQILEFPRELGGRSKAMNENYSLEIMTG